MADTTVRLLKDEMIPLLQTLQPNQQGKWGKMDAQQMVEHLRDVCKVANGRIVLQLINTDAAQLAAARDFLLSDAPFKENTRVPMMPSEPRSHKYASLQEAIEKMAVEMEHIFTVYGENPSLLLMHPVFGELDYALQMRYLDKHVRHHLRQFGLVD